MKLPGQLTISKVHGRCEDPVVEIQIQDMTSRLIFVEASISLKEFAQAITGLGGRPCELDVEGLERVGKHFELKSEEVLIPDDPDENSIGLVMKACKPYEVDGWVASYREAKNVYNRCRVAKKRGFVYRIGFRRWVDKEVLDA